MPDKNRDGIEVAVIQDFGEEWRAFDQRKLSDLERQSQFDGYFSIVPWGDLLCGGV